MRRVVSLLLAVALLLTALGCQTKEALVVESPAPTETVEPTPEPTPVPLPQSEPFYRSPLADGSTLELYLCGDGYERVDLDSEKRDASRDGYKLMSCDTHTAPVCRDGAMDGEVTVERWIDPTAGELVFVETTSSATIEIRVTKPNVAAPLTVRRIDYGTAEEPTPQEMTSGDGFTSETSLYIESGDIHLKSGRAVRLTDRGSTVYSVDTLDARTEFTADGGEFRFTTHIYTDGSDRASYHFAVCGDTLVDWTVYYRAMKVVNFDATNDYLFLSDGHYYAKPTDYSPCEGEEGRFIYKTAASFVHRSAVEQNCGAYLRLLGLYLMYTRIESFNDEGFVPNPCRSQWLYTDYGIDAGFYDTRFNTDAIRALMFAENAGDEPLIRRTVERALDYYLSFDQKQGFYSDGSFFVPDYTGPGQTLTTHSSLNHYLAEGMLFIEAGQQYGRDDYTAIGLDIFGEIEKTHQRWIRETGDLWYGVSVEGEMVRDDYVSVTYNDLVSVVKLLDSMGELENYPGIRALLSSKEGWLEAKGYSGSIVAHP